MKNMLIAVDGSECSLRAVYYAGRQFSGNEDLQITILHVLPFPPAPLWDAGHIPAKAEYAEREREIERWLLDQNARAESLFDKATAILAEAGLSRAQITIKTISDSSDIADSILEETRDGGYQTLVIGRCGHSTVKEFLMGSITTKIVNRGAGVAICIVE
ncbi:MAG TPA: universal stress protein [Dissulfurispiraceae bacterium]|nr:universal stress protein [Dissulfurispiraceae bacterium]